MSVRLQVLFRFGMALIICLSLSFTVCCWTGGWVSASTAISVWNDAEHYSLSNPYSLLLSWRMSVHLHRPSLFRMTLIIYLFLSLAGLIRCVMTWPEWEMARNRFAGDATTTPFYVVQRNDLIHCNSVVGTGRNDISIHIQITLIWIWLNLSEISYIWRSWGGWLVSTLDSLSFIHVKHVKMKKQGHVHSFIDLFIHSFIHFHL